ncbi:Baculovirus F protein [Popillia japonica]|uniref:Baculovirus F protein n=1 Tax=Popillia japonica TaxID=7064 RepID=A0AAW1JFU4_POPJA
MHNYRYIIDHLQEGIENLIEHNYRYIIDHLQEGIENLIEQILPNHRQRRGIINGLGSIIKVITGNMDQEDAERINQQIQDLQQGQKNNAKVLKKQISLAKNAIVSFNNTISNLKHNQIILTKLSIPTRKQNPSNI